MPWTGARVSGGMGTGFTQGAGPGSHGDLIRSGNAQLMRQMQQPGVGATDRARMQRDLTAGQNMYRQWQQAQRPKPQPKPQPQPQPQPQGGQQQGGQQGGQQQPAQQSAMSSYLAQYSGQPNYFSGYQQQPQATPQLQPQGNNGWMWNTFGPAGGTQQGVPQQGGFANWLRQQGYYF